MKKIAMIVFSPYPHDVRVRREAEALYESGYSVDIFCRAHKNEPIKENVDGNETYRVHLDRKRTGIFFYFYEYFYFFVWSFLKITYHYARKRYDVVHIHNMPDFLVFTAIIPKLFGAKIILDLHDPMPELFSTIYSIQENHLAIKFLIFIEKASIRFANHVITPNISFRKLFISRSCKENKINIIMNSPDEKIFNSNLIDNNKGESENRFIIMYHGAIVERSGLDLAVKAVALLKQKIPNLQLKIYGGGNFLVEVKKIIDDLKINDIVEMNGLQIVDKIAAIIPSINVGIIPNRFNSFTQLNFPVRVFEYLVMNKPVIVPRTQGIMDYFGEDAIIYFDTPTPENLAVKLWDVYSNTLKSEEILKKAVEVFNKNRWSKQKQKLIKIYQGLIELGKIDATQIEIH